MEKLSLPEKLCRRKTRSQGEHVETLGWGKGTSLEDREAPKNTFCRSSENGSPAGKGEAPVGQMLVMFLGLQELEGSTGLYT